MPTEIKFNNSNTQKINYTYTADGSKVRKVVSEGGNLTTTDYTGAYQYVNNDLEFIRNFEDGYVYPKSGGGFGYAFYYTDQLDNIRLAYTDTDGNGSINPSTEIIKESHFYPFGMLHKGYNSVVNPIGSSLHKYDYQNQERQDELGLNWLQFKYRMHDPEIGRFISVYPLAEDYVHNSTYAFAENKVIKYNELEGLEITLNKFDRMSYDNKSWTGKAGAFAANAGISIANGAIDAFNYAGDLTDPNAPLTGLSFGANKLASDAGDTASAISSYAENTTLSEFGSDVGNVLSDVETYENLAGALISGAGATKLGSPFCRLYFQDLKFAAGFPIHHLSLFILKSLFRFIIRNRREVSFGWGLTFLSSFGQTFLISLYVPEILKTFGLSNGSFGSIYAFATFSILLAFRPC